MRAMIQLFIAFSVTLTLCSGQRLVAEEAAAIKADVPSSKVDWQAYQKSVDRGVEYLLTKGQAPDGSYSARPVLQSPRFV